MNQESNKSINTPQQWACKYDAFLLNEYEFTNYEFDTTLIRGLEYYTGPIFEVVLKFKVKNSFWFFGSFICSSILLPFNKSVKRKNLLYF